MREKVKQAVGTETQTGITPAHAGKRFPEFQSMDFIADHPRTCGEKFGGVMKEWHKKGSPPHMRGKESEDKKSEGGRRITPAHAGKSFLSSLFSSARQDHPRTCGEKESLR